MLRAYVDRSYYTTEQTARVICALGLSDRELRGCSITASAHGSVVGQTETPTARTVVPMAMNRLEPGTHTVDICLHAQDGRTLVTQTVRIVKRPPKPGFEVKIDRERRIILRGGKPFFPLGFLWDAPPAPVEELRFNAVSVSSYTVPEPAKVSSLLEEAARRGVQIILRTDIWHPKLENMTRLPKLVPQDKIQEIWGASRSLLMRKYWLRGKAFAALTRQERAAMYDDCYEAVRPEIAASIEAACQHKNLLAYMNVDEPGRADLRHFDIFGVCRRIYGLVREMDGYRPVMTLYPSIIPGGQAAMDVSDIVMTDPYWIPGREGNTPDGLNYVSRITALQEMRIAPHHKVCVVTPLASWWSMTHKRALTHDEILCQSYLAMIHGAKALVFWRYNYVAHQRQWAAYARLGREIPVLAPALLGPAAEQNVTYEPGEFDPVKEVFPDVQACLFRDSKGGCLLLAANSRNYPATVRVTVPGLRGQVTSLFSGTVLKVEEESFTEHLGPLATRTYRVEDLAVPDGPTQIRVHIDADRTGYEPERHVARRGRPGKRNILINPSFEQATLSLWPDYYRVGMQNPPIGHPDCPWTMVEDSPVHGRFCLRIKGRRSFRFCLSPLETAPTPYVFSVYLRTNRRGAYASFDICGTRQHIRLTDTAWTRHSFPVTIRANAPERTLCRGTGLTEDATVWMDAMQFEKGAEPTEFEP